MAVDNTPALKVEDISFSYKGQQNVCINKVSLEIKAGERFALLGPNGAGKSTLMHLFTGLLSPDEGSIHMLGDAFSKSNIQQRNSFGYVPQDFSFYEELSPQENFNFFGAWYGMSSAEIKIRSEELLNILGLEEVRNKVVRKFSGGMKRRVNLAIGVLHKPKLLFLDEPTVGVDVQTRNAILVYLKKLNLEGTTLLYTSHQMKEVEELCERIALIDSGRIIVSGDIHNVFSEYKGFDLEGIFLHLTGKEYRD
ncbi:MAG: ABC transporter ATP-binding protein [Bacteroidia bacterium]|nr:ABC transporter ATP-binding protein [Bacteroidia bacterium]